MLAMKGFVQGRSYIANKVPTSRGDLDLPREKAQQPVFFEGL